eukprot:1195659-Prorocentrum_minimum.AAC.2
MDSADRRIAFLFADGSTPDAGALLSTSRSGRAVRVTVRRPGALACRLYVVLRASIILNDLITFPQLPDCEEVSSTI